MAFDFSVFESRTKEYYAEIIKKAYEKLETLKNDTYAYRSFEQLLTNSRFGVCRWNKQPYYYACPSPHEYSEQFFWDSCFHSIVMSHYYPDLAKDEITSLFKLQDSEGFIPLYIGWYDSSRNIKDLWNEAVKLPFKMLNKNRHYSQLIQPPIIASSVMELYTQTKDREFLSEVVPKLNQYYKYLRDRRDPDRDYLISIIHPFECLDESPVMNAPLGFSYTRKARLASVQFARHKLLYTYSRMDWDLDDIFKSNHYNLTSVFVNCLYAWNLRLLSKLNAEIGNKSEAESWNTLAERVEGAILAKHYDESMNVFLDSCTSRGRIPLVYIGSLMPLLLDIIDKRTVDTIVDRWLCNPKEFWTNFPVPDLPASSTFYNPGRSIRDADIWGRGNTWVNTNWLIYMGLKKQAALKGEERYSEIADRIWGKTEEMLRLTNYGFYEYYNSITGRGYGAPGIGWNTLFSIEPSTIL